MNQFSNRIPPDDLSETLGDAAGERTEELLEGGVTSRPGDMGATGGVGVPEAARPEELAELDTERAESEKVNPSDLNDPGDPEAGDDGVVGGHEAGGEESLGGTGGEAKEAEPWDGFDVDAGFESSAPIETLDEEVHDFLAMEGEEEAD